jgi:hypothetical protein
MARPQKIGLDYFPMDCHPDKKLKAVIRKFGAEGFGVVVGLFQHIYSEGYFVKWTNDFAEDFSLEMNVDESIMDDVLSFCMKRDIFDNDLFKKKRILTSSGIQKRYLLATERRKCSQVDNHNLVNVDNNPIDDGINEVNDDDSTQSKVNKSKVNDIYTNWDEKRLWDEISKANENRVKNHGNAYTNEYLEWFYFDMISPTKKGGLKFQDRDSFSVGGLLSNWAKQGYFNGGSYAE